MDRVDKCVKHFISVKGQGIVSLLLVCCLTSFRKLAHINGDGKLHLQRLCILWVLEDGYQLVIVMLMGSQPATS